MGQLKFLPPLHDLVALRDLQIIESQLEWLPVSCRVRLRVYALGLGEGVQAPCKVAYGPQYNGYLGKRRVARGSGLLGGGGGGRFKFRFCFAAWNKPSSAVLRVSS